MGVFEGALISLLLNGFLLYFVMQISAWGGEISKLAVEYFLYIVFALFPWTLSVPAHSITALYSQKNEILSVSHPNSGASICNWIKHLHSLPISHFETAFPRVLLMHIRLKGKPPFFPTRNEPLIWSKNLQHRVHTYACTGLQVLREVSTVVSFWGTCS